MRGNSKCKKVKEEFVVPVRQSGRKCAVPRYLALFENESQASSQIDKSKTKTRSSRNSQKRKEKSRDAARCRRGKESEIFGELESACPLASETIANLDKASVMRLSIAYLKTRDFINRGLPILDKAGEKDDTLLILEEESLLLKALGGFILVMTTAGDVVYASKNISTFLGLSQIDTMGLSITEFAHPCDHEELRRFAALKRDVFRNAFVRLKCTITPKGRSVNLKSASYKVVHMCGRVLCPILCKQDLSEEASSNKQESDSWVVALAMPMPHPSNIEIPLDKQIFVSRHSLDMKFTYIDENIKNFCGYESPQLMGRSMYEMNHALDADPLRRCYKTLFTKGQVETSCYRFLALGGGFVWVVTQATLICNPKDNKPQCVVCLNYVVSEVIDAGSIVSEVQLLPETSSTPEPSPVYEKETDYKEDPEENSCSSPASDISTEEATSGCYPMPIAATSSLIMERTEDMEEGFLTFSSNDPYSAVFKEEPEDLTHLAPSVGDDFLPLDIPLLYPSDIDDFLKGQTIPVGQGPHHGCSEIAYPFVVDPSRHATDATESLATKTIFSRITNKLEDRSNLVPDLVQSPYRDSSQSPVTRLDTPDPPSPLTPLLSQASTSCGTDRKFRTLQISPGISTYRTCNESTSESSPGPTMDLFSSFDLKLEDETSFDGEEFDMRTPYVAPMDDILCSNHEDLLVSSQLLPSFDLLPVLEKPDGSMNKYGVANSNIMLRSPSPLHHSKGCVDPNTVLPGHFRAKGKESATDCEELRNLLQEPRLHVKRSHSPAQSLDNSKKSRACGSPERASMQQLLVSKAPAKGRFVGSKEERRSEKRHDSHSVLRNLLVSGYDERAGYTVVVAGLPHSNASSLKNDRSMPAALQNLGTLPVNSEGKVELTKQQLSTILGSAGLRYVSIGSEAVAAQPKRKTEYLLINAGMPKLRNLSQLDCEVNAPASMPSLLQGSELLNALDQTI